MNFRIPFLLVALVTLVGLVATTRASAQTLDEPPPPPPPPSTVAPDAQPASPPAPAEKEEKEEKEEDLPELARPTPVPPPARPSRLFGALEAGYTYQTLYGISMNAADINGFIGVDLGSWGVGVDLEVMPGRTDEGLSTLGVTLGCVFEGHLDRLRIGGGLRLGAFSVSRVTTDGSLGTASAGMFARLSYDVVRFDDAGNSALFLVAKGSLDAVGDALYGVTLGAGVRF